MYQHTNSNLGLGLYVQGQGHEHLGPGTSLVQRINWTQAQENMMRGMGCGSCGGKCGKCGGLGLFDSGMDFSGWGTTEWLIVAVGGYMVLSTVFTTGRAVRRVRAIPGERRKAKAAKLRARASELTKKK